MKISEKDFVREVYLHATPSVDLDLITEQVDCSKHTLPMSVLDELVAQYCESDEDRRGVFWFMLHQGPQLVEG